MTLSSHLWVVMLGVTLGIVTMRFAAGIFTKLIVHEPILAPAAYVLVLVIGLRLFSEDILIDQLHLYHYPAIIKAISSDCVCHIGEHSRLYGAVRPFSDPTADLPPHFSSGRAVYGVREPHL